MSRYPERSRQWWIARGDSQVWAAIELAEAAVVCGPGAAWWRSLDEASQAYGRACMGNAKAVVDEVRDVDFGSWAEVPGCRSCDELVLAAVSRLRAVVECLEAKE